MKEIKYAVVLSHDFDADTRVTLFDEKDYDKAKAYLHWLWESYYNEEIKCGSYLNEYGCHHEDEYAQVEWEDGDRTFFELVIAYDEPEDEFEKIDWEIYL